MPEFENIEQYLRNAHKEAADFVESVRANPDTEAKNTITFSAIVNKNRVNAHAVYRAETTRLLDIANGLLSSLMLPKVSDAVFNAVDRVTSLANTAQAYNFITPESAPVIVALISTYDVKQIPGSALTWSISYKVKLVAYSENLPPAAAIHTVLESYSCEITPEADLTKIVSLALYENTPK